MVTHCMIQHAIFLEVMVVTKHNLVSEHFGDHQTPSCLVETALSTNQRMLGDHCCKKGSVLDSWGSTEVVVCD